MAFVLVPHRELTSVQHGECGVPYRVTHGRGFRALCSAFPRLYWPGRGSYTGQTLNHRVAIYEGDQRVALHDCRYPIHDVAFHPSAPEVALATGEFDGAHYFDGELLVWNWQTGTLRSLLGESRMVLRCRYADDRRIVALLKPRTDDSYPYEDYQGIELAADVAGAPLHGLRSVSPEDLDLPLVEPQTHGVTARPRVWDLAWTPDDRLAVALDGGGVELWDPAGERLAALPTRGTPIELLRQTDQLLVHVFSKTHSTLLALAGGALVPWRELPGVYTCSIDANGRVLARDVDGISIRRKDQILSPRGELLHETDLGNYDRFNHYLRLDGGRELYCLRGTPASQHERKMLCSVDERGGVREVITWDAVHEHRLTSTAIVVDDDVVRAYVVRHPQGTGARRIERVTYAGEIVWQLDVSAGASVLCAWPAADAIAYALLDGTFGVVAAATGELLHVEAFALDGASTIVTALAVLDETIVLGTIQGRLVMLSLR